MTLPCRWCVPHPHPKQLVPCWLSFKTPPRQVSPQKKLPPEIGGTLHGKWIKPGLDCMSNGPNCGLLNRTRDVQLGPGCFSFFFSLFVFFFGGGARLPNHIANDPYFESSERLLQQPQELLIPTNREQAVFHSHPSQPFQDKPWQPANKIIAPLYPSTNMDFVWEPFQRETAFQEPAVRFQESHQIVTRIAFAVYGNPGTGFNIFPGLESAMNMTTVWILKEAPSLNVRIFTEEQPKEIA